MKKSILPLIALYLLTSLTGCKYYAYGLDEFFYRTGTIDNRAETIEEIDISTLSAGLPDEYKVLFVSDVHFGAEDQDGRDKRCEKKLIEKINNMDEKPAFCINLGDSAEHGLSSEFKRFVKEFETPLYQQFGIKTFNIIGNHDLYNSGWSSYKDILYPGTSSYHFVTKNFSWYFIDSASCSLGNRQMTLLQRKMSSDNKKKIVLSHVPAYADGTFYFVMQNTTERNKFISMCAENDVKALFVGHTHKEIVSDLGKFTEYNAPGLLDKNGWIIATINEKKGTVSCQYVYAD